MEADRPVSCAGFKWEDEGMALFLQELYKLVGKPRFSNPSINPLFYQNTKASKGTEQEGL